MLRTSNFVWTACFACALALLVPSAVAQPDDAVIGYRQKVMGSIVANMGSIGDILKFRLPYQANIADHARNIRNSAKMIPSAFEKRVTAGPTDAKPGIWQDWDEFKSKAADLERESGKLAEVAGGGDMKAIVNQIKAVGEACKACHKEYRKPKEQSYKNR